MAMPLPGNLICELRRGVGLTATSIDATTGVSRISKWADQSGNGNDFNSAIYPFREPNRLGVGFDYDPGSTPKANMTMAASPAISARNCTIALCFSLSNASPFDVTGGNINMGLFTDSGNNLNLYFAGGTNGQLLIYNGGSTLNTGLYPISGRNVLIVVSNSSGFTVYLNDLPSYTSASPSPNSNLATSALGGTGNQSFAGFVDGLALYNVAVGVATVDQIKAEFDSLYLVSNDRSRLVIFDGDSLCAGLKAGLCRGFSDVMEGMNFRYVNTAVCGAVVTGTGYDLTTKLAGRLTTPFLGAAQSADRKVVVVWAGTNDIVNNSKTGAQTATDLRALITAYRTAGFDFVILLTMLPRAAVANTETQRTALNTSLRTDLGGADVLIDLDLDTRLGVSGAQNNSTYYYSDNVHLLSPGQQLVADKVKRAVLYCMEIPLGFDRLGRTNLGKWLDKAVTVDANNYPNVNMTDIGGATNVGAAGYAAPDWGHVNAPTTTVGLTNTTISTTQAVASVSGAVGSVTGAVGSVTGAVGSVTGNVGGNVVGSVGSVVATVAANLTQILGTALTETAGYLAAGFKKFFNIAVPTLTTGGVDQIGDSYAIVNSGTYGNAKLVRATVPGTTLDTSSVAQTGDGYLYLTTNVGALGANLSHVSANVTQWNGTAVAGSIPPDAVYLRNGTAQAGGASTITLDAGASATNNFYQNAIVFIRSGTGVGQCALAASYVGSTKVLTIVGTWAVNPDNTSVFSLLPFGSVSATVSGNVTVGGFAAGLVDSQGLLKVDVEDWHNVAVVTSVPTSTYAGADTAGTTTLLSRIAQAFQYDANNLPKVDVEDWHAVAVTTTVPAASTATVAANVTQLLGTAWLTPAVAGTPDVNAKQLGGQTAALDANNLLKVDVEDWHAVAVTTSVPAAASATVSANVVQVAGQTANASGAVTFPNGTISVYAGGAVASVTAGVTVATNNDKTGYALTAGEHTNIATDTQTGLTAQGYTSGRGPKLDNLDAAVSAVKTQTDKIATNSGDSPNAATAQTNAATAATNTAASDGLSLAEHQVVQTAMLGGKSIAQRIQVATINGSPTGGTFTLTYNGATTSALAYNASAATVQTALVALSTIGAGNATVSGSAGGPYTITLGGSLNMAQLYQFTATASFTGGTSPSIALTTQIEFKKSDGTTTCATLTFNGFDGIRSASAIT